MDKSRYTFHVRKRMGWATYEWEPFYNRYPAIKDRKEIIHNSKKGYLYDHFNFHKLEGEDGLELLINIEFEECQTFIDWEYFINAFKDTEHTDFLKLALSELETKLLKESFLIRLNQYKALFPEGIFIKEVRFKIALLEKRLANSTPAPEKEKPTEADKRKMVQSINEGKSKIEKQHLDSFKDKEAGMSVIDYIIKKKKDLAHRDIEKILEEAINTFENTDLDRKYIDQLIQISARYRIFRFQEIQSILTVEDKGVAYASFVSNILNLFNLIIDENR